MFRGDKINVTEKRAVLHVALRAPKGASVVVDGKNVGFVSPDCDPVQPPNDGFCYDTSLIGNSNTGHLWGTTLSPAEKENLLAYLLTL